MNAIAKPAAPGGVNEASPTPGALTLSSRYHLALGLIQGGKAWQSWAETMGLAPINLSEPERLEFIQQGLHANSLVLIRAAGLLVHPIKLMQIGDEDLITLSQTTGPLDKRLRDKYDLFDETALANGQAFLEQLGVAGQMSAYDLSLAERIALARLAAARPASTTGNPSTQEAASWAVTRAATIGEFVNLLEFYLTHGGPGTEAASRAAAVDAAIAALYPLVMSLLQCPVANGKDVDELLAELRRQLRAGNRLAFRTPAEAYRILAANGGVIGRTGSELQAAVDGFMKRAEAPVLDVQPRLTMASQDGASMRLHFKTEDCLDLAVDTLGCVVIENFSSCGPVK